VICVLRPHTTTGHAHPRSTRRGPCRPSKSLHQHSQHARCLSFLCALWPRPHTKGTQTVHSPKISLHLTTHTSHKRPCANPHADTRHQHAQLHTTTPVRCHPKCKCCAHYSNAAQTRRRPHPDVRTLQPKAALPLWCDACSCSTRQRHPRRGPHGLRRRRCPRCSLSLPPF